MSLVRWALVLPGLGTRRAVVDGSARVRELVHAHLDAIDRPARRLGVPTADLDDVVQDVMLVVVRRLADIELDKERAFLISTTVRVAANRRRRRKRRPEDPSDALDHVDGLGGLTGTPSRMPGEGAVETSQRLALLHVALDAMTEPQRAAFILFELEELTARQIAEQLAVTEGTIVSRVRRAREVLWRVFEDHGYPGLGARRAVGAHEVEP
jgi:RNA polymerase sigma-70 factor (ECF subfamily)